MAVRRLRNRFGFGRREADDDLFDPSFLSRFDRVRIRFGRVRGQRAGETPVRGLTQESGIEVESFKSYTPGDDIRHVDWNAVGRLDQLLTRRFVAEREIPVHVFVDASASMGVPESDRKFPLAVRTAAALCWVALNNNESVRVTALRANGSGPVEESPVLRHIGRFPVLEPFLSALAPSGRTALAAGIRSYLGRHKEGGLGIVISDFLVEDDDWRTALETLTSRRLDVWAIQIVGRRERNLEGLRGRFRLHDVESGEARRVVLSEKDRRRYRDAFEERLRRVRGFCHRSGIGHAAVPAERGVEYALTEALPREGMLRLR